MRKITRQLWGALLISALLFFPSVANATTVYSINENFSTTPATNWGFSTVSGQTFTYDAVNKLLQVRPGSPSSYSVKTFATAITQGTDNKITVQLVLKLYTNGNSTSGVSFYFRDSNGKALFGLGIDRNSSQYRLATLTNYPGAIAPTALPGYANILAYDQPLVNVTAVFDMSAKTLSYSAVIGTFNYTTRVFTATTGSVSVPSVAFIDPTAGTDIGSILTNYYRAASGSSIGYDLMYVGISTEQAVSTANVTVNYLDPTGVAFKTANVVLNQVVGSSYSATMSDKTSYNSGGNYYAYDALSTSSDNVVVTADGFAAINLKFKQAAVSAGTYVWSGSVNSNWSEVDNNFIVSSSSLAYQNGNAALFGNIGTTKSLSIVGALNLSSGNVDVTADGYNFSGTGSLNGTGTFNVNPGAGNTTTLNLVNNLTGGLNIQSGTAFITTDASGTNFAMADGSTLKLQTGSTFTKPIAGLGTITLEAASNNYYNQAITGASTVNIILDNAGSGTSSTWSDYFGGSFPSGAQINVTTGLTAAGFGAFGTSLINNKVNLGDGIRLLNWYNQASSAGGTSTIAVGELNGSATSTIEGGMVDASNRILAYEVGSLNTDATFAGVIKNYGTTTISPLQVYKKGTGTWTLTGASTYSPGIFNVDAGKVIMNGSLSGTAVPVTVAAGAILGGTGTIAGATTINGTLQGSLNFGSSLTLAGTTNIVVNGFTAGQFDVVNVAGALTYGGALNVTVNGGNPAKGTAIKILNFASQSGTLSQPMTAPANYSFDVTTGTLTYDGLTGVNETGLDGLSIYPTLSHGVITISGANASSVELVNNAGQTVKQVNLKDGKTTISLTDLTSGAYLVKVKSIEGAVKVQKVIYQK